MLFLSSRPCLFVMQDESVLILALRGLAMSVMKLCFSKLKIFKELSMMGTILFVHAY